MARSSGLIWGWFTRLTTTPAWCSRGYADGAGNAVLSGGRYDGLTAAFGRSAPATGFAVDADAVAGCLPLEECPPAGAAGLF